MLQYICRRLGPNNEYVLLFVCGEMVGKFSPIFQDATRELHYYAVAVEETTAQRLDGMMDLRRGHGIISFQEIEFYITPLSPEDMERLQRYAKSFQDEWNLSVLESLLKVFYRS